MNKARVERLRMYMMFCVSGSMLTGWACGTERWEFMSLIGIYSVTMAWLGNRVTNTID